MAVDNEKRKEVLMPLRPAAEVSALDDQLLEQAVAEAAALGTIPPEIEELPDGSAIINDLGEMQEENPVSEDHFVNLAEHVDQTLLTKLSSKLLELIEYDKKSREQHDKLYAEGLKRTGLGEKAPGGAQFSGASEVAHPVLTEACVDFAASASKELLPASGPARTRIHGAATKDRRDRADRLVAFLNWQLTEQCPEFMPASEQLLTQLGLAGTQYLKVIPNLALKRPEFEFVPVDDSLVPFSATSYRTAGRRTHVQRLTRDTVDSRVTSGLYRDLRITSTPSQEPKPTPPAEANQKIEGRTPVGYNDEEVRVVYEIDLMLDLEGQDPLAPEGTKSPYIFVLDELMVDCWALYRNWEPGDITFARLDWSGEYSFIPWRGVYSLGFAHLIGGLSGAATGALRALLDSAHIANMPSGVRLKGSKITGQTQNPTPTEISEIEGPPGVNDIRHLVMPMPFPGPSPVLFQLLGFLVDAGKGVVTTAEEKISSASNNMPVGTALALIEQGAKVFSSIHSRLHRAQSQVLRILCRVNRLLYQTPEDLEFLKSRGAPEILLEDLAAIYDVSPASDPLIFSETQRLAQAQALKSLAAGSPLYDQYAVERRVLEALKIPDIDEVLPKPKVPSELNAPAENLSALMGQPIMAFPEQDHLAHIETHVRFLTDPFLAANELSAPTVVPLMLEHIKQHLGFFYVSTVHELASQALGTDVGQAMADKTLQPKLDEVLAAASKVAHEHISQTMMPVSEVFVELLQMRQELMPPPMQDPAMLAAQVAKQESERRAVEDQMRDAREKAKQTMDMLVKQLDLELKSDKQEQDAVIAGTKIMADMAMKTAQLEDDAEAREQVQENLIKEREDELQRSSSQD